MAVVGETVWAIDIGTYSLKALRLSTERGVVEVIGFDNIRHGKILSAEDLTPAEREELVALSLRKFVNRHDVSMDEIVVSVPGQNSFARFVKLPPVEEKRIPEIVRFEAVQQIPFDINDVQWDWQLMSEPDAEELKVGLFAIKNEIVNAELEHYNREDLPVGFVQMAPMALYNYAAYDRPELVGSDTKATMVLNVGASSTDLVVCTKSGVWQRGIMIGGNTFTKAIADTFRLNFEKAEKLKRTAPMSKYARQLFQAMRPVYTDLASEVQQSLGFYNSSNPNTKVSRVIALGGGTKLRGLLKYLQQTLQIPVERPDAYKKLAINPGISAAKFHENVCNFGVVYGLGLQGLGLASIESNLLPSSIARSMAWAGKGRYFMAAACLLLGVSLLCLGRTGLDHMSYANNGQTRDRISTTIREVDRIKGLVSEKERKRQESEQIIQAAFDRFQHREVVPNLHEVIFSALPNEQNNPGQAALYQAFRNGNVDAIVNNFPREQRKQIFVTNMVVYYSDDLSRAKFGGAGMWRTTRRRTSGEDEEAGMGEISEEEYEMMMMMEMQGEEYEFSPFGVDAAQQEAKKTGFVVSLAGYSPYGKDDLEFKRLLDPPGVENQPSQWGFVTRLMHLDQYAKDGNSPFELYEKGDPEHFRIKTGEVALDEQRPAGIGATEMRPIPKPPGQANEMAQEYETVIVDPMTREIINKVPLYDPSGQPVRHRGEQQYEIKDHWFALDVKFVWNPSGESEETQDGATTTPMSGGGPSSGPMSNPGPIQ